MCPEYIKGPKQSRYGQSDRRGRPSGTYSLMFMSIRPWISQRHLLVTHSHKAAAHSHTCACNKTLILHRVSCSLFFNNEGRSLHRCTCNKTFICTESLVAYSSRVEKVCLHRCALIHARRVSCLPELCTSCRRAFTQMLCSTMHELCTSC